MDGARPTGRVIVFDDDNYYLGSVVASALAAAGAEVTIVTPVADGCRLVVQHRRADPDPDASDAGGREDRDADDPGGDRREERRAQLRLHGKFAGRFSRTTSSW